MKQLTAGMIVTVLLAGCDLPQDDAAAKDTGASSSPYSAANMRMHEAMSGAEDPDASRAFAKQMTAHHQGALEMAQVGLQQELDPEMRALAEKIIADQTREIEQMRVYLQRTEPNR